MRITGEAMTGDHLNGTARLEATLDAISGAFAKTPTNNGESVCIQCVNRKKLTFAKIAKDIGKVLKAPNGVPNRFRVVAQSKISAYMRDKIKAHVTSLGVKECDTWSGPEFEEFLRHGCGIPAETVFRWRSVPGCPARPEKACRIDSAG